MDVPATGVVQPVRSRDGGCHLRQLRHANIRKALQYAVRTSLLDYSPVDRVERSKKEQFAGSIYNDKELEQLFEITKGDPIELGVILAAFYGLRRGVSSIRFTPPLVS